MNRWDVADIRPIVDDALELFGPKRLMVGSDWPVSLLAGCYARTFAAIRTITDGLDAADKERIFGGTAVEFYRIDRELLARIEEEKV